ncbi:tyrosine-type recombinase/integrase [Desulfurispora thermophila]|uniref:tyrosine-type recombinase/integrase n=1 Tax=Desulfurispora thermophila TaxID=265470 RepID=UPI00249E39D6|nr:tyrosine-type recombinase/integrase [Desulfurispora thermophila]
MVRSGPGNPACPRKFLKKHGLPPLSFHGLWYTAATMLINQGLPAKSISGHLGHANIGTTMDIYGHYLKSADREAADRLERVYQTMKESGQKGTKKGRA